MEGDWKILHINKKSCLGAQLGIQSMQKDWPWVTGCDQKGSGLTAIGLLDSTTN